MEMTLVLGRTPTVQTDQAAAREIPNILTDTMTDTQISMTGITKTGRKETAQTTVIMIVIAVATVTGIHGRTIITTATITNLIIVRIGQGLLHFHPRATAQHPLGTVGDQVTTMGKEIAI